MGLYVMYAIFTKQIGEFVFAISFQRIARATEYRVKLTVNEALFVCRNAWLFLCKTKCTRNVIPMDVMTFNSRFHTMRSAPSGERNTIGVYFELLSELKYKIIDILIAQCLVDHDFTITNIGSCWLVCHRRDWMQRQRCLFEDCLHMQASDTCRHITNTSMLILPFFISVAIYADTQAVEPKKSYQF